jgi:microsomal dipeptidase-like Zn-dependent dipeptidase
MSSHLYGAIAIAAMIATPAIAQTTAPTSNTMSTLGPGAGTSTPTLSHDGSASLTNSNASSASNSPGAGASPHTDFSSGMTPTGGTASGTADGTTDTGAGIWHFFPSLDKYVEGMKEMVDVVGVNHVSIGTDQHSIGEQDGKRVPILDLVIVAGMQRIEHYEVAAYGLISP